ncbi:ABC transporter permease [Mariniradius sediminis]|uniref:ABC transporter permease n=1 Tax=Mariniradius sediminis TaxID=2909237 RepID=A0ABS9BYZ8_9BACT|nr:ABC transporter permease [Mariniradius sediminis]MCF1753280.1 ABC transporter permease [Mariniradius sediminis]
MWKNYFKTSFRNLSKRKLYTGINILGLTIALCSFFAISLYIYHEWSYDRMYTDYERIYKFSQEFSSAGESQMVGTTPASLVPTLMEEFPEVEVATTVFDLSIFSSVLVDAGEGSTEENRFAFADANFFKVFDFKLLEGQSAIALSEPKQIVVTETTAKRLFNQSIGVVGKTLKVDGTEYTVSGVMEDFPSNSNLDFDFLASFKTHRLGREPQWSPANFFSYAKLRAGTDLEAFSLKISQMVDKYLGSDMREYNFSTAFFFQPVSSIHLGDSQLKGIKPANDIKNLYLFGLIAILLVMIGVINYVNLATAEATERNKEVGLRKVLGAARGQLFGQFVSESMILSVSSISLSILLLYLGKGVFENFSGVPMQLNLLFGPWGIGFLIAILLLVGLMAGIYPSLVLSGMTPLKALGNEMRLGGGIWLRKGLVVFQFFISMGLLIATLVVSQQLQYMRSVNLGYDREQVIALQTHYNMRDKIPAFKTELVRTGHASAAAMSNSMPIFIQAGYSILPGGDFQKELMVTGFCVDHDVSKTIGLELVAGLDFVETDIDQTTAYEGGFEMSILFNESAIREMGWTPEESVGKKVNFNGVSSVIKGVVKDFYFNSLHHRVGPLAVFIQPAEANWILIKLPAGNPAPHLEEISKTWTTMFPERPFNYRFLDDAYSNLYQSEQKVGALFGLFSGIAVWIACMGLFGLVSYVALRRTKEISIRKVLGADRLAVLKLLSADFFILLAVAALLAIPVWLWFSKEWLSGFAYQTAISPVSYLIAVMLVSAIAALTIGYRTVRVYARNPAETLKDQ